MGALEAILLVQKKKLLFVLFYEQVKRDQRLKWQLNEVVFLTSIDLASLFDHIFSVMSAEKLILNKKGVHTHRLFYLNTNLDKLYTKMISGLYSII